jgi:hypothetical protein
MMTKEELRIRFYALQKEYRPIMDFLTENQYNYPEYRGFDASPNNLIYKPKVLFLGYNPAGGKDWWRFDPKHQPHLFLWPHLTETDLFFFNKNSARKENAEWYELDKPVNNKFPRQMVDLLYELAALKYPEKSNEKGSNQKPSWADEFKQSIMFMNLYPVATKDGEAMVSLFRKICKENNTLAHCEQDEWHLRMFFIGVMRQMIKLIDPKVIVCMGSQTFHDYTYSPRETHSLDEILTDSRYDNLIGFSRQGSWDRNIPNIAKEIFNRGFNEIKE